ncbi:aldo/keto reductase family oxidoreductase [soil metagenome]
MKTYVLPDTSWNISRLAYGCGAIGGTWDNAPLDADWRATACNILDTAVEVGINFFDHADVYTFGKSEEVFGEFLAKRPGLREQIYLQSKCGLRFQNTPQAGNPYRYDFSSDHIVSSVEGSLRRLGTEYLDVLLLHRPDVLMEPEEVAHAFDVLAAAGKVRRFGLSNHNTSQVELLRKHVSQPLIINQLELSLPQPGLIAEGAFTNMQQLASTPLATGLLDYCRQHKMLVQAWSPLGGGTFYKGNCDGSAHPQQPLLDAIGEIANERGCSSEAIMLAWLLRHPARIQPILGTLNPDRLRNAARADELELSRIEWYALFTAALGRNLP